MCLTPIDTLRMRAAAPEFGYVFMTAYGLFRSVFSEAIRDHGMGKSLRQRAKAMARRLRVERGSILGAEEVRGVLKASEPDAFDKFRQIYFALDRFPENDARFPLTYTQVKVDAQKSAKAKR